MIAIMSPYHSEVVVSALCGFSINLQQTEGFGDSSIAGGRKQVDSCLQVH